MTGRVRLGASTGAIAHLLPQALARLRVEHPGIDVQVQVLTSQASLVRLREGTLDIGLVALPQVVGKGLTVTPWRRDPILAYVPADWQPPARITPAWLAQRALILNDSTTQLSRVTGEWFAAAGLYPEPRIELNYNDAIKSLVGAGYGATLLPQEGRRPSWTGALPADRCGRGCGGSWVLRVGKGRWSGPRGMCWRRWNGCGRGGSAAARPVAGLHVPAPTPCRAQNQRSFFLRPRVSAGRISPASKPAPAMLPPYTM